MDPPVRQLPLERVRLDEPRRGRLVGLLLVLDLDEPAFADRLAERGHEVLLGLPHLGLRRLGEVELAEGLLELAPDPVERRVRVGRDHRPDELEGEPDRARLQRREARRRAERLAVELLVDVNRVAVELRVDRVAAAAEVDEVEERQVLL